MPQHTFLHILHQRPGLAGLTVEFRRFRWGRSMIQARICRGEVVSTHRGRFITSSEGKRGYDSLLCYWAVKELGISTTSVANKLDMH